MNKIEISLDTPGLLPQYRHIHERHRHYEYNHSCVSSHPPRFQTISAMTPPLLFSLLLLLLLFSCPSSSAETFPIPPTARNLKGEGEYCYYEDGWNANFYRACEAGYYCPGYDEVCSTCDQPCFGTGNSDDGYNEYSAWKKPCPAGKFSYERASSCTQCEAGTYSSAEAATTCTQCDTGKASAARMATSSAVCQDCTEGKYSLAGSSVCTECNSGKYNSQTASSSESYCKACVAGTYNPDTGSTTEEACKDCAKGKYSDAGSSACTDCAKGKYNPEVRAPDCTKCEAGKYNIHLASETVQDCKNCTAGKYSPTIAATMEEKCTDCNRG